MRYPHIGIYLAQLTLFQYFESTGMIFGVPSILLFSAIAIASAQDLSTTGGQDGSMAGNVNLSNTTQPTIVAPPPAAIPNGADAAPAPPAVASAETQAPQNANLAPMTDTSGSFGRAGDIEPPVPKKSKRATDSSQSGSNTIKESSASYPVMTTGSWIIAGLAMGLAAVL